jgi:hypothetical protein
MPVQGHSRTTLQIARLDSHQTSQMPHEDDPTVHVRRVIMTGEMDVAIHRLLADLRAASGSNIDFSTMTRALWAIALESSSGLLRASDAAHVAQRPKNGDFENKAAYEAQWAKVLGAGLCQPLEPGAGVARRAPTGQ